MKILWLSNVALSRVALAEKIPIPTAGGWLTGISESLLTNPSIELISCFPFEREIKGQLGQLSYLSFSLNADNVDKFTNILRDSQPDIIHVFGTEYQHSLHMMQAAQNLNMVRRTVISIQGLAHFCAKKYENGLPLGVVYGHTIRSFLKHDSIRKKKKEMEKNGQAEIKAIKIAKNIIGRTDWDRACVSFINHGINYYKCNETLRSTFYKGEWELKSCERYSIFVSQSGYPIKGFHYMLEGMSYITKCYPDTRLYTTGRSPFDTTLEATIKRTPYEKYIGKLIIEYGLKDNIKFLGVLNDEEMKAMYLRANVFVSPSLLENSPNSLGEAMILGTPCVSSDVGGVKNLLEHKKEGFLYPADEPYMMAHYVIQLFDDEDLAIQISKSARERAAITHNVEINKAQLISIYESIYSQ